MQLESFNKSACFNPSVILVTFRFKRGGFFRLFRFSKDSKAKPQPSTAPSLRELQSEDENSSDSSAAEAYGLGAAEEMVLASSTMVYHSMFRTTEATGLGKTFCFVLHVECLSILRPCVGQSLSPRQ